ncbi:MAG: hypothetical protein H6849_00895 [Alphaproteobacteria bacterium]|nr:MAG: hypothetical protein H6849_00895 [Alphaproteobacteria bacterium]
MFLRKFARLMMLSIASQACFASLAMEPLIDRPVDEVMSVVRHFKSDHRTFADGALLFYSDRTAATHVFVHKREGALIFSLLRAGGKADTCARNYESLGQMFTERLLPELDKVHTLSATTRIYLIGEGREATLGGIGGLSIARRYPSHHQSNTIGVIGFSPTRLPQDAIEDIHASIGRENILSFFPSKFLSTRGWFRQSAEEFPPKMGIPMMILPSEQLADNWMRKKYLLANLGQLSSLGYLFYLAAYQRTTPQEWRTFLPHLTSVGAFLTTKILGDLSLSQVPSNKTIETAIRYTQFNIRSNSYEGYNIEGVGVPPLLSPYRGIGKVFHRLFS